MKKLTDEQILVLDNMIKQGYVQYNKHKSLPLTIYKYTNKCVYDGAWNDVTIMCKGLVLDNEYNIISRSFDKFFEYDLEEMKKLDYSKGVRFYEKIDGCQVKLSCYNNEPLITSTGSFDSDVVEWAKEIIPPWKDNNITFIFELCHPKKRIVLNYGEKPILYYIGYVHNDTGEFYYEKSWWADTCESIINLTPTIARSYEDFLSIYNIPNVESKEGFVFYYNNKMYKLKYHIYKMKHKVKQHFDLINKESNRLLKWVAEIVRNNEFSINEIIHEDFSKKVFRLMVEDIELDEIYKDIEERIEIIRHDVVDNYNSELILYFDNYETTLNEFMKNHKSPSSSQAILYKFKMGVNKKERNKYDSTLLNLLIKNLIKNPE